MVLFHREYGSGFPLVILHGLFGAGSDWRTVAQKLSPRFRVICPDLRNHGNSPHDPFMDFTTMAQDVLETMDRLSAAGAHLLGHSLGGKVALTAMTLRPGRFGAVVLADMVHRRLPPMHTGLLETLAACDPARFPNRIRFHQALAPAIPDEAVRTFLLKSLRQRPEGGLAWKFNLPALAGNYFRLGDAVALQADERREMLVIRGGRSDLVTDDGVEELRRFFPRLQQALIADAGHWVHADGRDDFVGIMADYLAPRSERVV